MSSLERHRSLRAIVALVVTCLLTTVAPVGTSAAGPDTYGAPVWLPIRVSSNGASFIVGAVKTNGTLGKKPYHGYWAIDFLDAANQPGAPVYAAGAGKVVGVSTGHTECSATDKKAPTNYVWISHDKGDKGGKGLVSRYLHLTTVSVGLGDWVDEGTQIGTIGSVGFTTPCPTNHLHFEVRENGRLVDPGSLKACHGTSEVDYPSALGAYSSWDSVPFGTSGVWSDGLTCQATTVAVDAGGWHSCALFSDGTVWCWGSNVAGQLGDGTTDSRTVPVQVQGLANAIAVSAGATHTCALLAGGAVQCWGDNYYAQLGDGTRTRRLTPTPVLDLAGATAISSGVDHTCALLSDRTVKCWGRNGYGAVGDGTTVDRLTPVQVSGISTAVAISAHNAQHSCALLTEGTVKCWGNNSFGALGNGAQGEGELLPVSVSSVSDAVGLGTRWLGTCARLAGGTVSCWGRNGHGEIGDGTTTDRLVAVLVPGIADALSITGGEDHTCVLRSAGTVSCSGRNTSGELGNGTTIDSHVHVGVSDLSTALIISAGIGHTCALSSGGTVMCWGLNEQGQLGDGTTTNRLTPTAVVGL